MRENSDSTTGQTHNLQTQKTSTQHQRSKASGVIAVTSVAMDGAAPEWSLGGTIEGKQR